MEEEIKDNIQFTEELFNKSLNILKKKPGGKYDFITKSGQSFKYVLYNLFSTIWETERKPDIWRNTNINGTKAVDLEKVWNSRGTSIQKLR